MTDDASDRPARFTDHRRALIAQAYRPLAHHAGTLHTRNGPLDFRRDIYEIGRVAAIVPYDPERDLLVLQRQFRLAAHLHGHHGVLVELAAGLIEDGETAEDCARREMVEELGVAPSELIHAVNFMPSTGWLAEEAHLFIGRVDSSALPDHAGAANEAEFTEPFAVSPDAALRAVDEGRIVNGFTILGLLWFARHRAAIRARWGFAEPF